MHVKARVACQPGFDFGMLVGAVVVRDEVQVELRGSLGIELLEKSQPLPVRVTRGQAAQDPAVQVRQGSKQRDGAVANVVVRTLQRFLPGGPLAFLPLADGRSSIVWSTDTAEAEELMELSDTEFCEQLGAAFHHHLGPVTAIDRRHAFPLRLLHAQHYVAPGVALVGDAAALADRMLEENIGLVYGGGSVGLMGVLADRILLGGGKAIGVIPRFLFTKELAHAGLTRTIVTSPPEPP